MPARWGATRYTGLMMILIDILAALAGAAVSFLGAYRTGMALRTRPASLYAVANGVAFVVCVAAAAAGVALGLRPMWVAAFAALAGSLTGLKWGLARIVVQWRSEPGVAAESAETTDGTRSA
ncbi:MAG: hypothetical protein Q7W30_02575 [Coriobacteriia bacterium]|nr:hypothetical protein [Coriobacteriia bacterium]